MANLSHLPGQWRESGLTQHEFCEREGIALPTFLLLCCRAVGVNPRDWLNDTLKRILSHPVNQIDDRLPSNYVQARQDVVG